MNRPVTIIDISADGIGIALRSPPPIGSILRFAFEGEDEVRVVFKTHCGDCPGLTLPRVQLQMTVLEAMDESVDEIYFGTCVKKATTFMNCPMNVEGVTEVMQNKFGVPVHMGTHDY